MWTSSFLKKFSKLNVPDLYPEGAPAPWGAGMRGELPLGLKRLALQVDALAAKKAVKATAYQLALATGHGDIAATRDAAAQAESEYNVMMTVLKHEIQTRYGLFGVEAKIGITPDWQLWVKRECMCHTCQLLRRAIGDGLDMPLGAEDAHRLAGLLGLFSDIPPLMGYGLAEVLAEHQYRR